MARTKIPTIIDEYSITQLTPNKIKMAVWYDNEWSYSSQIIKLLKVKRKFATN